MKYFIMPISVKEALVVLEMRENTVGFDPISEIWGIND